MDEIKIFRDLVNTASRHPLEIGDMRSAVRSGIAEAKETAASSVPLVFPLLHDVYFRVASAAMAMVVAGLGLGYYSLAGMASEWSLNSAYYEVLGGLSAFWRVF